MRTRAVATALLLVLLSACTGEDSTGPMNTWPDLRGAWVGDLRNVPLGDWTRVTLEIQQEGLRLGGTLTDNDGVRWPVAGELRDSGESGLLSVGSLPDGCSSVTLDLREFVRAPDSSVAAIEGRLTGRCSGTVGGAFRLTRG